MQGTLLQRCPWSGVQFLRKSTRNHAISTLVQPCMIKIHCATNSTFRTFHWYMYSDHAMGILMSPDLPGLARETTTDLTIVCITHHYFSNSPARDLSCSTDWRLCDKKLNYIETQAIIHSTIQLSGQEQWCHWWGNDRTLLYLMNLQPLPLPALPHHHQGFSLTATEPDKESGLCQDKPQPASNQDPSDVGHVLLFWTMARTLP